MKHYRKLLIATSLGLVVGLAGCGSGGGYDRPRHTNPSPSLPPPPPPPPDCCPCNPWDYC
jgi:hypothetical protein